MENDSPAGRDSFRSSICRISHGRYCASPATPAPSTSSRMSAGFWAMLFSSVCARGSSTTFSTNRSARRRKAFGNSMKFSNEATAWPRPPSSTAERAAQNRHSGAWSPNDGVQCGCKSRRPSSPAARNPWARRPESSARMAASNAGPGSTPCRRQAAMPMRRRNGSAAASRFLIVPCKNGADTQPNADTRPRSVSGSASASANSRSIRTVSFSSIARTAEANTSPGPGVSRAASHKLNPNSPATARPSRCAATRSSKRRR